MNVCQLEQMWDILDEYGESFFEGIIVVNEIFFCQEMIIMELVIIFDDVCINLSNKNIDFFVVIFDFGDDWILEFVFDSDYFMVNIYFFFVGVDVKEVVFWIYSFWENQNL